MFGDVSCFQEICRSLQEKKTVTVEARDNKVTYDQVLDKNNDDDCLLVCWCDGCLLVVGLFDLVLCVVCLYVRYVFYLNVFFCIFIFV